MYNHKLVGAVRIESWCMVFSRMAMLLNYSSNRKLTAKLFLEIKLGYIYMALDYIKSELFHSHFILLAPPPSPPKKKPTKKPSKNNNNNPKH